MLVPKAQWAFVLESLDYLTDAVYHIQMELLKMSASFDKLKADVAAQTSVNQSAVTLINGIAKQLKEHDAADADLDALAKELEGASSGLATAVSQNTPAAAPAPGAAPSGPSGLSGATPTSAPKPAAPPTSTTPTG